MYGVDARGRGINGMIQLDNISDEVKKVLWDLSYITGMTNYELQAILDCLADAAYDSHNKKIYDAKLINIIDRIKEM